MKRKFRNRGAALLTVLVALMVISIMLFEFQHSAMVESKLAYNDLNQLQAYYLAKTGIRLGLLRITLYMRAKRDPSVKTMLKNVPQAASFIDAIWNLPLPAFPPEESNLSKLSAPDRDAAERVLNQTKVSDGKSTHTIGDESSKINLNNLVVPPKNRNNRVDFRSSTPQGHFWYTGRILINLMENFLRESENPEEYGDLRPEEVVYQIMDWVTPGDQSFLGGTKDLFYEKLSPPYRAKRNRFYTLNELKMVKGIDEHLFTKLRPHITVISDLGKINVNTNSHEDFYLALLPSLRPDDVRKILEERDKRTGWGSEDEFVQFIKTSFSNADFEALYPKKEDYPFTVSSQSFVIEAAGRLQRSNSAIQKIIRVNVTLKSSGANCDSLENSKCGGVASCFLDLRTNKCNSKPRTQQECYDMPSNEYFEDQGKQYCRLQVLNNSQTVSYDPKTDAPKEPVEPNALKILNWSEV